MAGGLGGWAGGRASGWIDGWMGGCIYACLEKRLVYIRCAESENDNPDGQRQRGGGQKLATVAKDAKILLPTIVYAKNRFTLKICFKGPILKRAVVIYNKS